MSCDLRREVWQISVPGGCSAERGGRALLSFILALIIHKYTNNERHQYRDET
jgi:hypothetical protein